MTVHELKVQGKRFAVLVLPWKEYEKMNGAARTKAAAKAATPVKTKKRLTRQDRGDIAEAQRRMAEPSIPWDQARRKLGL